MAQVDKDFCDERHAGDGGFRAEMRTQLRELRDEVRDELREVKVGLADNTRELTALKVDMARDPGGWRKLMPWIVAALLGAGGVTGGSFLRSPEPPPQESPSTPTTPP